MLGSASNWLPCSGFQTKLFGNLHNYAYTVSAEIVAQGIWSVFGDMGVTRWGSPKRERQTELHSQLSHMLFIENV